MPDIRLGKHEDAIPQYKVLRVSALSTAALVGVGLCVNTTTATSITPGSVVVTPGAMTGITKGKRLNIQNSTNWENVTVVSTTGSTFTAVFVGTYSGTTNITSVDGTVLGPIISNAAGSTVSLTLYNGSPTTLPKAGAIIAQFAPAANTTYGYAAICDLGLFYTYTGTTAGEFIIHYLDHPPQF